MPIPQPCTCGIIYTFKDEFAGRTVKCPRCKAVFFVGSRPAPVPAWQHRAGTSTSAPEDAVFDHDKFLLRQKHWAIKEKYDVQDEQGTPLLYIERPSHLFRNFLAVLAALAAAAVVLAALLKLINALLNPAPGSLILPAFLMSAAAFFVVLIYLYKMRHVNIYRDKDRARILMRVLQDRKVEILEATYRIQDQSENTIATLHKNYLSSIFRKRWECRKPDGSTLCVAKEDSLILALLRRLLGTFFGLLRINFVIYDRRERAVLGEFNRKYTILDRYVLDMSFDTERTINRRIAVALGVMLDTGERR